MKTVKFKNRNCIAEFEQYSNNRTAIELIDFTEREPVLIATVNLPSEKLPEGSVFIKDWSENEGVYAALLTANIIKPATRKVKTGYVYAFECELVTKTKS